MHACKTSSSSPPGVEQYKKKKHSEIVKLLRHVSELPKSLTADTVESSLSIIVKLLGEFGDEAFDSAMRLIPHYAAAALENRKCPTWQRSLDLLMEVSCQSSFHKLSCDLFHNTFFSYWI